MIALKLDRITRSIYDWENILSFLEENEAYLEVLEDMQDYRIISNDTIGEILKNKNYVKEKDEFER